VPSSASEPAVLISLSTYPFPGLTDRWQRMLAAVDGLAARVVATTGPHIDPATLRVPAGIEVHRWLDHAAVLPEMSLVIGHGGHGTTIAALAHGIPVAVSPLDPKTDQPYMGDSVAALGVGRRLGTRAKPAAIRAVIDELLAPGPHREAAERLGATIRGYDGRRGGADVIESVIHPSDGGRESC
jgi:UDP:flavonoid glycosyltransferase YjiC (YdhE family)